MELKDGGSEGEGKGEKEKHAEKNVVWEREVCGKERVRIYGQRVRKPDEK